MRDCIFLSAVVALASTLTASGLMAQPNAECGTASSDIPSATTCSGTFKVRAIFATFPNVVNEGGGTATGLPSYAQDTMNDFSTFIESLSLGDHMMDFKIVKRSGADSTLQWVLPENSSEMTFSEVRTALNNMLPSGWDTDLDLPIYFLADNPSDYDTRPRSSGGICNPGSNFILMYTGDLFVVGQDTQWGAHDEYAVNGILVHEYGHQLTARHLPDPRTCGSATCDGGYWSCYGAMNWLQFQGCAADETVNGFIPYHPYNLVKFGWLDVAVIDENTSNFLLGDVRIYGDVVKVPIPNETNEYFLLCNHQRTDYDDMLNGRGVLIWHIRENADQTGDCAGNDNHIVDLEHHSGRYEHDGGGYCFERPLVGNASAGVDSLDTGPSLLPSAFYPGVVVGGAFTYDFTKDTNPSSNMYGAGATSRRSAQIDTSGVYIEDLEAIVDQAHSGKYKIQFDVTFK